MPERRTRAVDSGAITLTGEVERVTYENETTGFRVLRVGSLDGAGERRGSIPVVGTFQAVGPGTRVRVSGDFVTDARHGEQFRAEVLVPIEPTTLVGLEKYLASGLIRGVGPALAKRVVEKFRLDTLRVLDHEAERLGEVPGLGPKRVREIRESWAAERGRSNLLVLLQSHGASPHLARRISEHYGERAAAVAQREPYRMALEVRGVGFKTADRLAESLGIARDHPERCQAGVVHTLEELAEAGHVCVPREPLRARAAELLQVDEAHVDSAIDALFGAGRVVVEPAGVFLAWLQRAEVEIATSARRLLDSARAAPLETAAALAEFEARRGIALAPAQRRALELAARERLVVITGGPGVGKTTILRALLAVLERGKLRVRLAAPTGRAAKRLGEATGAEACTLHRLLEFDPRSRRFQRGPEYPLDADVVVVDEASMLDIELGRSLLGALGAHARLVLVGDVDQLPSVGPGAVLRDLIDSGVVPVARLSEVFRQAAESRIVANAHRILRGEAPESSNASDPRADFFVIERRSPEEAVETVREVVTARIPRRFGLDPQRDVQVLTPMHRGPAGTAALNRLLQAALNPTAEPGLGPPEQELRPGDKVLQTKNDYDNEVFNGDLGTVLAVDRAARRLRVRFDQAEVEYDDKSRDALVLAYAISVHKSQGSEYPAVVVLLQKSHFVMLSKNLLYTAVTRARRLCVLVADPGALRLALSDVRREERSTQLAERLRAAPPA